VSGIAPPAGIFPIYFPIGNLATGFFVIFSLITGVVGVMTSLTGLQEVNQGRVTSILSAASSSFVTWALTLLAMG
jgi:AWPM-19-like family